MEGFTEVADEKKSTVFPLLIATVTAVVIAMTLVMGVGYYLAKSGRLSSWLGRSASAPAPINVTALPTHPLVLEPMVVNLADEGAKSYLRIAITLRVLDEEPKKEGNLKAENDKDAKGRGDAEAAVRDTVLDVLGRQTAEGLLSPEGKEDLKKELKDAFVRHNPDQKVTETYFTEFLVQR